MVKTPAGRVALFQKGVEIVTGDGAVKSKLLDWTEAGRVNARAPEVLWHAVAAFEQGLGCPFGDQHKAARERWQDMYKCCENAKLERFVVAHHQSRGVGRYPGKPEGAS